MDSLGLPDLKAGMVILEPGGLKDPRTHRTLWNTGISGQWVHQDHRVSPDPLATRDSRESVEKLEELEGRVQQDRLDPEDSQGRG